MQEDTWKAWLQHIAPKHRLTWFAGFMANIKIPAIKNYLIQDFIENYKVNMQEALIENPLEYACFNDFFVRKLKEEARPLANAPVVSPVDGTISEIGRITENQILQAKGSYYTLDEFLINKELSCQFTDGHFATFYLSPKDYHRIHMPIDAKLKSMIFVPGKLFSVQPATVRSIPRLFARNERLVVFFDTSVGLMAMVLVGAVIVGAIGTSWQGDIKRAKKIQEFAYPTSKLLSQGEEMGYFKLGSTVVLLFANNDKVKWLESLAAGQQVNFGQAIGDLL